MTQITSEILLAVLNSLWQAALVAVLVWAVLRFARLKGINAATRYAIWWAVLAVVIVLPAVPAAVEWWHARAPAPAVAPARPGVSRAPSPLIEDAPAIVTLPAQRSSRWPLWIAAVWAALLAYRLWQIGRSYVYLRGVKRRGKPAELACPSASRSTRVLLSSDVASPMAVGFAHPAVLLPESLPDELATEEMEHVLLHETAHIARRDDWFHLLGKFLGGVLALHPVAWWILREIEREREIACDDWVVARIGSARPYAKSLARMSELRWARQARRATPQGEALASGIFGGGSRLGERIELLLERGRKLSAAISKNSLVASGCALVLCAGASSFAPRVLAFAQTLPQFDVASVKLASQREPAGMFAYPGGRLTLTNMTLKQLVYEAYSIEAFQILGGAAWTSEDRFSIEARPSAGSASSKINPSNPKLPPAGEELLMLRALLAERFHLRVHEEMREGRVYELRVGSKGPKLDAAQDPNDFPVVAYYTTDNPDRPVRRRGINASMALLAKALSQAIKVPVIDRTGLTGAYDFNFYPDPGLDRRIDASTLSDAIGVLGLTLAPARGPIRYVVIDHVEKPDAN